MLYEQIRYATEVRKLYRLRHLLLQPTHPAIGSLLGYSKYSAQFFRIKMKLRKEQVLDRRGRFVESAPNLWVAELPLHARRAQTKALGHRVTYNTFLAMALKRDTTIGTLPAELQISRMAIRHAVNRLLETEVLKEIKGKTSIANSDLKDWLLKYIDLSEEHANVTADASYLFKAIPAYISGPAAYYAVNYEAGRPIGPSDMTIATFKPFQNVWESLVKEVRYFKNYPRKAEVGLANPSDEIVWISGIPYNKSRRHYRSDEE